MYAVTEFTFTCFPPPQSLYEARKIKKQTYGYESSKRHNQNLIIAHNVMSRKI